MTIVTYGLQGDFNIFNYTSLINTHFVTVHQSPINGAIVLLNKGIIITYGEDGKLGATSITLNQVTYEITQGTSKVICEITKQ